MISLDLVKTHCRLDQDFTDDDSLLNIYIGASKKYVQNYTRRTLYESETDPGYADDHDSLLFGDEVAAAMLLLIGHWYENREASSAIEITEVPFAVESLLQPYVIYGL